MTPKNFFYQKLRAIDQQSRYETIQIYDDIVVVNFDTIFDRDYTLRGKDELLYKLHEIGKDKKFLFISEDGANLTLSGAREIIKEIVKEFKLTYETCAVVSREKLNLENVTECLEESIPYWCHILYPAIKNINIPQGNFSKKFAVWFHRGTFYRLKVVRHLVENYATDSFISYQEHGMICDRQFESMFQDDITWANNNTPIVYDQLFPNRVYTHEMIVGAERKPYNDYFMEIVVETDVATTAWITEKTVKNLYIGKPFIVLCGHGVLETIRSFGFKTFSPWIDETYDTITNHSQRLQAILKEIDRLSTVDVNKLHQNLLPILEHNRQTYETYINSRR